MRLRLWPLPFWLIIILQILSVIIIIIVPNSMDFDSPLFMIPFIILEILIFVPILFNKWKWLFYLGWELQFFLLFLIMVTTDYDRTFQVVDPHIRSIGFVAGFLIIFQLMIIAGFFFREKAVKPILISLSSLTAFIVVLLILFVFNEGRYAFTENDPQEFLTGENWKPGYFEDVEREWQITTKLNPAGIELDFEDETVLLLPDSSKNFTLNAKNIGGVSDVYDLWIESPSSIDHSINEAKISIEPNEVRNVRISLISSIEGEYEISINTKSKRTGEMDSVQVKVIVTDNSFSLTPKYEKISAITTEAGGVSFTYNLSNDGDSTHTYNVTISSNDYFKPFLYGEKIEWNYTSKNAIIELGSGEWTQFVVRPTLMTSVPGKYFVNLTVISMDDFDIRQKSVIEFTFFLHTFIDIPDSIKSVPIGGNTSYPVEIFEKIPLTYTLENTNKNWRIILHDNETIYIDDIGIVSINKSEVNGNLSLTVYHIGGNSDSDDETFTLTVKGGGYLPSFGIKPFIVGSFLVTIVAIVIAIPIGLGCSIFLAEYMPSWLRKIIRPMLELLAGIPSVVYGLWGFLVLSPFLYDNIYPYIFDNLGGISPWFQDVEGSGRVIFTAGIVLAIMILPIIITLSEDSIRAVPRELFEGSLALGTTKWQAIKGVIIKKAKSGIIASFILATGRAIGETMAVVMVMGFVASTPESLFDGAGTMTSIMAIQFMDVWPFPLSKHAMFAIGCVLFTIVFILNTIIFFITSEKKNKKISIKNVLKKLKIGKKKISGKIKHDISILYNRQKMVKSSILRIKEYLMISIFIFSVVCAVGFLLLILTNVLVNGGLSIEPRFIFEEEKGLGEGGFLNAILGSIAIVIVGLIFATPLSLGAAIYIVEYAKRDNIFNRVILFASDTLASTPSIVFGVFGFAMFVMFFKFKFSMIAGGLTLGIMVIPLLLRSSIEALKSVPQSQRDGSLALGASKWGTIKDIVIPSASPGISSGVILSIGRAIGETAAVLLTAGYSFHIADNLMSHTATLPNMIYQYYQQSIKWPELEKQLYAAAFILIVIVLILNSIARFFKWRASRMMKGRN